MISGPVAAGKTTLGVQLAARLPATLLSKDLLKEALHEPLAIASQETSLVASNAAMHLMYSIAARSASALVLEANWKATDVEPLTALARPTVQIFCTAPVEVLKERALTASTPVTGIPYTATGCLHRCSPRWCTTSRKNGRHHFRCQARCCCSKRPRPSISTP